MGSCPQSPVAPRHSPDAPSEGPIDQARRKATRPYRDTLPYVGNRLSRRPAGCLMEPPVSVPLTTHNPRQPPLRNRRWNHRECAPGPRVLRYLEG
jgi:hypothetical protein